MAFWSSDAGRVHNVLLSRPSRVISSNEVKRVCRAVGVKYKTALAGLTRAKVIVPVVFKGIYYVRDRDERDLETIRKDALDSVAQACALKLGKDWYFGLATALFLSGIWGQQALTTITVISKRRIQRKSRFAGMNVEFRQLAGVPFSLQVSRKGHIRFSEPSRTVLDYAYFGARDPKMREFAKAIYFEYSATAGGKVKRFSRIRNLIRKYPRLYGVYLRRLFEE
ncbi:MAG: hypothetical protein AABX01_01835 [Candidatus Micrarchaeota archaeon]